MAGNTDSRPPKCTKLNHTELDDLVSEVVAPEASLAKWSSLIPHHWNPLSVSSSDCIHHSIRHCGMYGESWDVYPSIEVAGIWNWYRTLHISTIRVLLVCYTLLDHASNIKTRQFWTPALEGTLQTLTDDFCGSVPFHLGNRRGDFLISDPRDIHYPILPQTAGVLPAASLCTTDISPGKHKRTATLIGTWYLLDPIQEILNLTSPDTDIAALGRSNMDRSDTLQPLLQLRKGQKEWILTQMKRIKNINERDRQRRIMPS